jgi:hypothetical protein
VGIEVLCAVGIEVLCAVGIEVLCAVGIEVSALLRILSGCKKCYRPINTGKYFQVFIGQQHAGLFGER